jgi:hypothetical protein
MTPESPLSLTPQAANKKALPYDPILSVMASVDHARRTIRGILESYNSNYDAIAEAIQNAMDALEDAALQQLPGPYLMEITVDLKNNSISVFDTGIGMTQDQVCEAFAPSASFKDNRDVEKKRGQKHPYRGYKGVGLTFLAYGTDDIQIQSRQNGTITKGRMRFGRQWVEGKRDIAPPIEIDAETTALDKHRRGTYVRFQLGPSTRPASLAHLGSTIEVWESIIRTRTAAGQILIDEEPLATFIVRLRLIDKNGVTVKKDISPEFYYPHLVTRKNPPFRFLNVGLYHKENPAIVDHAEDAKRQDAVYLKWNTDEIARSIGEKAKEFQEELKTYTPRLYAFRPYHAPTWGEINTAATQQERGHFFGPGLVVGVNHQQMAETVRVKISRSDLVGQNVFVLVHFYNALPDQGRKTLQSKIMELAQEAADAAIQYLLQQGGLLKPAGEKTTSAQRAVERNHEEWIDNVKQHAKDSELSIPPVSYISTPMTEQDVVGLFHQLSALGMFPGLRVYATSAAHTYDCYVMFKCKEQDLGRIRYSDTNPLGLSSDILAPDEKEFSTRGLTLEFKNNIEGLIDDMENQTKRKAFGHIHICVCWGKIADRHRWYTCDQITETNLHERHYPGVTHILRKDGEGHVIQVIMLEDIINRVKAGHVRLA